MKSDFFSCLTIIICSEKSRKIFDLTLIWMFSYLDNWDFLLLLELASNNETERIYTQLPLSFGHLPLSGEESYRTSDESCRSLLGELSSIARLRGFNIQPVIASNSEAIQDDIHSFFDFYLDRHGFASRWQAMRNYEQRK